MVYWTDLLADDGDSTIGAPDRGADTSPVLVAETGLNARALWLPFTRAGCDVGAVGIADIDLATVFGRNSAECRRHQPVLHYARSGDRCKAAACRPVACRRICSTTKSAISPSARPAPSRPCRSGWLSRYVGMFPAVTLAYAATMLEAGGTGGRCRQA